MGSLQLLCLTMKRKKDAVKNDVVKSGGVVGELFRGGPWEEVISEQEPEGSEGVDQKLIPSPSPRL